MMVPSPSEKKYISITHIIGEVLKERIRLLRVIFGKHLPFMLQLGGLNIDGVSGQGES